MSESEDEAIRDLRAEVALMKIRMRNDPSTVVFNELYYIVTREYENWDEGRTVDWEAVQHACALMVSAIRRGQME